MAQVLLWLGALSKDVHRDFTDEASHKQCIFHSDVYDCYMTCSTISKKEKEKKRCVFTLGAKLTIFPHPFILRSALTTPPIRVPSISLLLFNSTAALSSNRTIRPSGRRTAFLVRTMTARRTSPLRTFTAVADACAAADTGRARMTTQTISSPTEPQPLLTFCLRTLTHSTRRAPELSMTCEHVKGCQTRHNV
jgi:hypothetical protein